ncbi:MAG: hypothetical protein KAH57_00025 [Thermoplasmata archaeon]|nr:hypothetical protein [Thermoplasmata archaeon]
MRFVDTPECSRGFRLVPSLAVMGKVPVWVTDGKYRPIVSDGETLTAVSLARTLQKGFSTLHYIDIFGMTKGDVEWNMIQPIMDTGEVWGDVGAVDSDSIIDLIMAGATEAVVSTKMIGSLDEIASCFEMTENLIVQIDYDGAVLARDELMRRMTAPQLVEELVSLGVERFIMNDMTEGREHISSELIERVDRYLPKGGATFMDARDLSEVEEVDDRGASGAVISCSHLIEGLR